MAQNWNTNYGPPQGPPPQQQQQYYPGPSQPYAPSAPQGPAYDTGGYEPKRTDNGERFVAKKGLNDPIILVLFLAQFFGAVGLSGYVLNNWIKSGGNGGGGVGKGSTGTSVTLDQHTAYLLLLVTAAALLLSTTYLMLVRQFTRLIMHITLVLSIVLNIAICAYYWYTKYYSGAIIFTIIAIFGIFSYFGFRRRIPLAALLLDIVMDIANHHLAVYVVAFAALFLQGVVSVWFVFTSMAIYGKWTPDSTSCASTNTCSSGKVAGLIFFITFSYLWTSQVIGNMALATLAGGPFGGWYYFGPKNAMYGGMPKRPTISALGRAFKSLGSIAFGSLIVTLLDILRIILNAIQNNANADGQPVEALLACCAACFVGCIEGMVEYFNRYAYIEIALYGKSYITAAKDTWRLLKDRGIDALVNDSLVSMTLTWGAYVVGISCSLFGYLYLKYTHPSYNDDGSYTPVVLFFAFIIGIQCSLTMTSAIEAGVSTIFVGLGEDPQVLAIRAPELFGMIAETYPQVVRGVNGR